MATVTETFDHVADQLAAVQARIVAAARAAGREPADISLVAVSKAFPPQAAQAALEAGHRLFGENRVQEAQGKWPPLKARYPDAELHLIGPLQTNKVKAAVALFDAIETVDRPRLAAALAAEMERTGKRPDCFIEINTGAEAQKAGIAPEQADAFIERCRDEFALPVVGLMCIPPLEADPAPHFELVAECARRNGLRRLSMGMSADFEIAIQHGATHVRVGTAIFGARPAHRAHG
jgi:pyridoxal phosphate enzyme (YggS family)